MKKGILLKIISIVLVIATFGGLAACGQGATSDTAATTATTNANTGTASPEASGDASKDDITVYTALEDEQVTEYLADFNKKFPDIKVNIVRESTGIITAKLLAEKDNPQADVVWGTAASSLMVLDNKEMLEPYTPAGVDKIVAKFKSDKQTPTWVGIDAWETAFVVNTDEAKKLKLPEIKSYQDLLKPEFKGHIVMPNPNSSGTGFLTVSAILQLNGKDTEKGWEYLDKLHENTSQYVHSGSKPAKMAAAGETAVGISFGYAGISQKSKGAPVEVIFPSEGSGWDLEANALMKKAEIKPAAKTFLDWAISADAMKLYQKNYPIIATGEGGKYEGFSFNPVDQLIDNDFSWASENREGILKKWMSKYDVKSAPKE
jgi:putative 2-aminoethylphosphonate ABC transporter, periplasmic 2-aminoethylphosphonate-binding protein